MREHLHLGAQSGPRHPETLMRFLHAVLWKIKTVRLCEDGAGCRNIKEIVNIAAVPAASAGGI